MLFSLWIFNLKVNNEWLNRCSTHQNIKLWVLAKIWAVIVCSAGAMSMLELSTKAAHPQVAAIVSVQYQHDVARVASIGGTEKHGCHRSKKTCFCDTVMWAHWNDQLWEQIVLCYCSDFTLICKFVWVILCASECHQQVKGCIVIVHSSILAKLKWADLPC